MDFNFDLRKYFNIIIIMNIYINIIIINYNYNIHKYFDISVENVILFLIIVPLEFEKVYRNERNVIYGRKIYFDTYSH